VRRKYLPVVDGKVPVVAAVEEHKVVRRRERDEHVECERIDLRVRPLR
jgi:hypothetical protein